MKHVQENVSLRDKTSYKIGGPARYYILVQNQDDIGDALLWANKRSLPVFVLGKGSNILVSDAGWQGLVVDLSHYNALAWKGTRVECQSGVLLHSLVKASVDRGYTGMEKLAGIPGSIGGGLIMNAGAFGQTVSDCLVEVSGIDRPSGSLWRLEKSEIRFGYRTSSLKTMSSIVTGASFNLEQGDKEDVRSVYRTILQERNKKQPVNMPSCGSVFKRPKNRYAGELIEKSGLKGCTVGGATISRKHANFIVTKPDATASDVRKLIAFAQERVFEKFQVLLEPEVIFVGPFATPLYKP